MSDNKKPAIRFKGFDDDWEQRKLGELIKNISTGKSVNSNDELVSDEDINCNKKVR